MAHQERAVEIARLRPRYGWFWKPGTGKTIAVLAIQRDRPMRTLIVAARSIMRTAWARDSASMGVPTTIVASETPARERLTAFRDGLDVTGGIVATNYELLMRYVEQLIGMGIERVVLDESIRVKNRDSKTYAACRRICDVAEEVYILNGTPAPNCRTELWGQLRCLSPAAVRGDFFSWAHRWFFPIEEFIWIKKYNRQTGKKEPARQKVIKAWQHKAGTEGKFAEYVASWSQTLGKAECVDLPEQVDEDRLVDLSRDEHTAYGTAMAALRVEVRGRDLGKIDPNASLMKQRQIASGFVIAPPLIPGQPGTPHDVGSSKLDELDALLDELGRDESVVIWAQFRHSIDRILRLLNDRGEAAEAIYGGTSGRAAEAVAAFASGEAKRIVCHPLSAGHGVDGLQERCSNAIFYELSFSSGEHEQARDRIHRRGQRWPCTYHYLCAAGTVEEGMLDVVRGKATAQEVLERELGRLAKEGT